MDNRSFLTELQQRLLKIFFEAEKDSSSLFSKENDDEWKNISSYFKLLLLEKHYLQTQEQAFFAVHLIDEEIRRLFMTPVPIKDIQVLEKLQFGHELTSARSPSTCCFDLTDSNDSIYSDGEEVTLSKSILIPVDDYPSYNFIGRIIGPRGMTAKQLEKDTGCRIMIRGSYSNKTYGYSSRHKSASGDNNNEADSPLRVVLQTSGSYREASHRINEALEVVNSLLVPPPDGRDELKRRQLLELAIMNGTYRPANNSDKSD